MEFRILGPLEVRDQRGRLDLGPAKQRALLAILLLHANEVVSSERLTEELWTEPPATAPNTLQVYVGRLRKALEPERPRGTPGAVLATHAPGYALHVDSDQLDSQRFEALVAFRIRVEEAGHGGTDFEAATIRDMRRGRADLAFVGSRAWDEFGVRSMRALSAPFLIDSYELQERVLTSDLPGPMLEELRPLGLVGIGMIPGPIRRPLGVAHRLAAPIDFKGLTIATHQSRVAVATLRALGARCELAPRIFRDKPWRRLSDTPSRRYLSKRCPPPAAALRD